MTQQGFPSTPVFVHVTLSWLATLSVEELRNVVHMHKDDRSVVIRVGDHSSQGNVFTLFDHRVFSTTTVRMSRISVCTTAEWQRSVVVALGQTAITLWRETQHGLVIHLNFPISFIPKGVGSKSCLSSLTSNRQTEPEACLSAFWLPKGAVKENGALWHWTTTGNGVLGSEYHIFLTDPEHRVVAQGREYIFEAADRVRPIWAAEKERRKKMRKHQIPGTAFQASQQSDSSSKPQLVMPKLVVPQVSIGGAFSLDAGASIPSSPLPQITSAPQITSLERILPSAEALLPWTNSSTSGIEEEEK